MTVFCLLIFFFLLLEETVFEDFVTAQPAASQTAAEADGY